MHKQRSNWHKLTEQEQLEYERITAKLEADRPADESTGLEVAARVKGPVRLSSPFEGLSL